MEACGSSHHWGRVIGGLGHRVELLPAQHVSKCRIGEKTDRRDVGAILSARRRQDIVPVPVKSVEQQAVCSLHRVRAALIEDANGAAEPAQRASEGIRRCDPSGSRARLAARARGPGRRIRGSRGPASGAGSGDGGSRPSSRRGLTASNDSSRRWAGSCRWSKGSKRSRASVF